MLSVEALQVAIEGVEAELNAAEDWHRASLDNETTASSAFALSVEHRQNAARRVEMAREALEYLQGLREPETADSAPAEGTGDES